MYFFGCGEFPAVEDDLHPMWAVSDLNFSLERRMFLFVPPSDLAGQTKTFLRDLCVSVVRQELGWGCDSYGI
jgi:hypothetical protein